MEEVSSTIHNTEC